MGSQFDHTVFDCREAWLQKHDIVLHSVPAVRKQVSAAAQLASSFVLTLGTSLIEWCHPFLGLGLPTSKKFQNSLKDMAKDFLFESRPYYVNSQ